MKRHAEKTKNDVYNEDYRTAMIIHALIEPQRDKKKRSKPFKVEEFMPQRGDRKPEIQTPEEQAEILKRIFA